MDKEAILKEIRECYDLNEMQPEDLTLEEVSENLGVCQETARVFMKKLIGEGKFMRVKVKIDGHAQNVYRKTE